MAKVSTPLVLVARAVDCWCTVTHTQKMGTHMKTTIELSDVLLESAKQYAQRSNTTLRALIEAGLSRILTEQALAGQQRYVVPDLSVGGGQMLIDPANWRELESEALLGSLPAPARPKRVPK
jgi:hypothetical protein